MRQATLKQGFTLLSMLVSMILGSILMGSMFTIYNGISRSVTLVQRIANEDTREVVIIDRLQKDFLGLATMWNSKPVKSSSGDSAPTPAEPAKGDIENKYFYSVNKGEALDFLTCITTNPLYSYAEIRPHFIRVVYRVEADPLQNGFFRLMRKEIATVSDKVTEEDLKGGVFSELARGVRSIKMHYYYFKKPEEAEVKAQANGKEVPPSLEEISEWDPNDEKMKEKISGVVPYAIKIEMLFEDNNGKQKEVNFRVDILSDVSLNVTSPQPAATKKKASTGDQGDGGQNEQS